MPRFLLSALISLAYALIFAYSGTYAHPYAYRHKWYPKQWRPAPYTGKKSTPLQDNPELRNRCRQLCESTGLQLLQEQRQGAKKLEVVTPGPYTRCPLTNLDYRIVAWSDFVVVCPFHPHEGALILWDSRSGKQLDAWRTPASLDDEGRFQDNWLRAQTAHYSGDLEQALTHAKKLQPADRPEVEMLLIDLHLALGQPEQALKVYTDSKHQSELARGHCNCLLELGRFQEVAKNGPNPAQKCMAEVYLDQPEAAANTLETVKEDPLFEAYALLALKRYADCSKRCREVIRDEGWQANFAGNAVMTGVLCDWLSAAPEDQTRAFLQKGLNEAPKTWPYPLLRYLNRELCEQELLELAGSDLSRRVEAQYTIGLALLAQKRDLGHAREMLRQAAAHGQFFEAMVAHSLLK